MEKARQEALQPSRRAHQGRGEVSCQPPSPKINGDVGGGRLAAALALPMKYEVLQSVVLCKSIPRKASGVPWLLHVASSSTRQKLTSVLPRDGLAAAGSGHFTLCWGRYWLSC